MGSDVLLFCKDRLRENLHYYHSRAAPLAATLPISLWRAGVETVRLTQLDPFLLDSPAPGGPGGRAGGGRQHRVARRGGGGQWRTSLSAANTF